MASTGVAPTPALSRTTDAPALLRSYSLSGEPRDDRYRVSIKRETHGAAGAYVEAQVRRLASA
jgi:ferredoxin-NADP reductase